MKSASHGLSPQLRRLCDSRLRTAGTHAGAVLCGLACIFLSMMLSGCGSQQRPTNESSEAHARDVMAGLMSAIDCDVKCEFGTMPNLRPGERKIVSTKEALRFDVVEGGARFTLVLSSRQDDRGNAVGRWQRDQNGVLQFQIIQGFCYMSGTFVLQAANDPRQAGTDVEITTPLWYLIRSASNVAGASGTNWAVERERGATYAYRFDPPESGAVAVDSQNNVSPVYSTGGSTSDPEEYLKVSSSGHPFPRKRISLDRSDDAEWIRCIGQKCLAASVPDDASTNRK